MGRSKRTRKVPVVPSDKKTSTVSHKATQATISKFHTLLKQRKRIEGQLASSGSSEQHQALQQQLDEIDHQVNDIGGLEAYQHASTLGQSSQRGGDSSHVLIKWLKSLRASPDWSLPQPLRYVATIKAPLLTRRMLEIGALTHDNYAKCSKWIDNHPIDLHSRHPAISEEDFLQRDEPESDAQRFDVISCSLVLNFVPDARDRGELGSSVRDANLGGRMLRLCRAYLHARPSSLLFIVLPLPCVSNSRYTTVESFKKLVMALGFKLVQEHWRPRGKVAYWLWQWDSTTGSVDRFKKKQLLNDGPGRNNFVILVE